MGGGKHFNVSINPHRPTWSLLRLTFKLREVGGGHISMRPFLTLGSQSPSRSEWYREASGEFGEDLHDADLCRRVAHKAISKRERRMRGGSAQHRPMPPRGPQGRLQMSGECGESLHNADPYHRVAHKAVSEREWRMQGGSAQHRPMPPRGPQGRFKISKWKISTPHNN